MNFNLISHQHKAAMRSPIYGKSIGIKLLMGFIFFIISLELLGFAFFVGTALAKQGGDPLNELLSYFIYFFAAMLILRSLMQKLPTMAAMPYLLLPIKKSRLVNFILTKPLYNILNIIPIIIIVPILIPLSAYLTSGQVLLILASIIICDLFVNYLAIYIKRVQIKYEIVFYIFLLSIVLFGFVDHFNLIDIKSYSASIFQSMIEQPVLLLVPAAMFLGAYFLNYRLLFGNFSLEEFSKGTASAKGSLSKLTYFERFGKIGEFMMLEMKMIVRNKRSRTLLMISPLFALYGLMIYPKPDMLEEIAMIFVIGVFMTGSFMMNYGLYLFSWESAHFDLILTSNSSYLNYLRSKYHLMVLSSLIMYFLVLPYTYFGFTILLVNTVALIFNIGANTFFLLYFACNNNKYMDVSRGAAFNYQGVSSQHFFLMIPLMLLPLILYAPFGIMGYSTLGLAFIGTIGLLGIIFHEKLLIAVTKRFIYKKYKMAEGFRIKS
ncbi:hypothetical protein DWB61_04660 [Ancylomarina euxinus]|uniref:Uncharacterized protein n=1 Tax=Ancylomarina euxinus TaxID=2283627 RepID=A0A425Y5D4_9BACT|nr:DUF5687 family protein [Ancylomarina euxinus]MCZ4694293.1 DUF5687 family protein [Ancylomarina euxinus]MUP14376.1 hypothetical protein [Ancylomarina euxinus]RRG23687.1 hypothetical protein DWB61_04660 [Ancylomarina euxinus]